MNDMLLWSATECKETLWNQKTNAARQHKPRYTKNLSVISWTSFWTAWDIVKILLSISLIQQMVINIIIGRLKMQERKRIDVHM